MKKLLIMIILCVFAVSANAQRHRSRSTRSHTTTISFTDDKIEKIVGDGYMFFASRKNYKENDMMININYESGECSSIDDNGNECPPTHIPSYTLSYKDTTYKMEQDEAGHLTARDGNTIVFEGAIYFVRNERYLVGKLFDKQIKLIEPDFN